LKKYIFLLPLLSIVVIGCATVNDLKRVQSELNQKIDSKVAAVDDKLSALKTESAVMRSNIEKNAEAITALQKSLAGTGADIADIRDNLQQLRGQADSLRKDLAALSTRTNNEYKDLKDNITSVLNNVVFKINFIENFLEINKKEEPTNGTEKGDKLKDLSKGKPLSEKESTYASAYELFKDGKFERARDAFQNFLKQYPNTEYSDNAQFWIAECYYFEKKYENAILEYEKVAKNYPEGDKVPHALLKQGISFLNLGDKASAKLILQKIIKEYPNTNQARTAKAKLITIK
jgi:tol-pal system protein YbgF